MIIQLGVIDYCLLAVYFAFVLGIGLVLRKGVGFWTAIWAFTACFIATASSRWRRGNASPTRISPGWSTR